MALMVETSGQLVWAVANTEACLAGSETIQPTHFWLGVLKLVDKHLPRVLHTLDCEDALKREVVETAQEVKRYLEIDEERAAKLRRALRKKLRKATSEKTASSVRVLHRSKEARSVFAYAGEIAHQAGGKSVSALHIARALFDTGYITVKGLTPGSSTDHPSDGARWKIEG